MIKAVLVTGANGFIGTRLAERLQANGMRVLPITRSSSLEDWENGAAQADAIVHLAGVTQSDDPEAHRVDNLGATQTLAAAVAMAGRAPTILYASTTKADDPTPYGRTKKAGEDILRSLSDEVGAPVGIFRLPHVFGPGARPNYNSIVVTLCHRRALGEEIALQNPDAALKLLFIDDLTKLFVAQLKSPMTGISFIDVAPTHSTTVGAVAASIARIGDSMHGQREIWPDGSLQQALQATFDSFTDREEPRLARSTR